jgi:hypothetical protein
MKSTHAETTEERWENLGPQIQYHSVNGSANNDPANFFRILEDAKRTAQYLIDLQSLIVAAQRVTWYGRGPGSREPDAQDRLATALFRLSNLVGYFTPPDTQATAQADAHLNRKRQEEGRHNSRTQDNGSTKAAQEIEPLSD